LPWITDAELAEVAGYTGLSEQGLKRFGGVALASAQKLWAYAVKQGAVQHDYFYHQGSSSPVPHCPACAIERMLEVKK
jgi:hypothetical protein